MVHFTTIEGTAKLYAQVMDLWLPTSELLTLDWLEFRYEDTCADLAQQSRRLLEFLGLDWDDRVLRFHEIARDRAISPRERARRHT